MTPTRQEHGSEFHWIDPSIDSGAASEDEDRDWLHALTRVHHASGRGALRALVELGGWPRVWLPCYVCAELASALGPADADRVRFYADDPTQATPGLPDAAQPGDAIVRINYFGLRGPISAAAARARGLVVIDDHTHDPCGPWARSSDADYCLASLRKSLPLPDGAITWSPRGLALPPAPPPDERAAAKLPAMLLKALYLRGHQISKPAFRELAIAGEAQLGALGVAGMSTVSTQLLATLPIARFRARRRENFRSFASHIELELLPPASEALAPFACVLHCADRASRDQLRQRLIHANIYPALLWPLDELPGHRQRFAGACELADRMLALHCDARYGPADMQRVAASIKDANTGRD